MQSPLRSSSFPLPALLLLGLTACSTTRAVQEAAPVSDSVSTVSVNVGLRQFSDDLLEDVELDEQTSFGVEFDTYGRGAPIGWEFGFTYSSEDESFEGGEIELEMTALELYGGVRKTWDLSGDRIHPFFGGGLSVLNGELDVSFSGLGSDSEDDTSIGAYLHGGMRFDVIEHLLLGVDLRYRLGTDLEIADEDIDSGYFQMAALLGFSF